MKENAEEKEAIDSSVASPKKPFEKLLGAYRAKGPLSKKDRKRYLKAIKKSISAKKEEAAQAISDDFRGRSKFETQLAEVFPLVSEIRHLLSNLDEWMDVQDKDVSFVYWPASLEIRPQALGVVGVISPWNYPLSLCLVPLCNAIAAGNRVLIKPSEYTPKTAEFIKSFVGEIFPEDVVQVLIGGVELSVEFSKLPFHHLFFTGSTSVGKKVMAAAASNLTPVTLELGGKSPAIIHSSFSMKKAVDRIIFGKLLNSGQTCIAPDYVLCPEDRVDEFLAEAEKAINRRFTELKSNENYTSIVSDRHRERLCSLLDDAREKGAQLLELNPANETFETKIPPTILTKVTDEMLVMQEEIFGPILPIVTYSTLDEAIRYVNERPRPLALYYFDNRSSRVQKILDETVSGGVCINETMLQYAQDELPFGGVGNSGIGRYHGRSGFETFSYMKPVLKQSRFSLAPLLTRKPYPKWVRWAINLIS